MQGDPRERTVADSLSAHGIEPTSIARRSDSREPVYEVRSGSGRYFAKLLKPEKASAMRDVFERELAVGMPDGELVRDGTSVLVTEPAAGTPLSIALPVCSLPGLWAATADSLSGAAREVGAGLGELHAGLRTGDRRADDDACRLADRLGVDGTVRAHLPDRTVRELNRLFDELRGTRLPFTRIHGDPTPHNVFWDARTGGADVIDFNLHPSVAVEDLAVFESGIELMVARLPHARRSQAEALLEAFRSGYVEAGVHDPIPARTVAIAKLAHYAHLLGKFLRGASYDAMRDKLTRYTDRRIAERKIEALTSRL